MASGGQIKKYIDPHAVNSAVRCMFVFVLPSDLCCTSRMQDAGSDSFSRCTDCLSSRYAFKPQHCVREDRYRWLTVSYYTHSLGNSDELVKSGRIVQIKEGCSDCSNLLFSLVFVRGCSSPRPRWKPKSIEFIMIWNRRAARTKMWSENRLRKGSRSMQKSFINSPVIYEIKAKKT